jgi:hypothetical protein
MPRILLSALLLLVVSAPLMAQDRPVLVKRSPDGSETPVTPPPSENPPPYSAPSSPPAYTNPAPYNMLVAGTSFIVRLDDTLDTARLRQGKHFKAKLAEDLLGPTGAVLIPRGRKIKGHVSEASTGLHARLLLSFDEIDSPHGWIPLIATITGVPGEHAVSKVSDEGEIERRSMDKKRAIESAAVGAAVGAAAGGAAGGGRGAGIGAGAGAGLGALTGILTDRNMRLEKGQPLEVRLDRDTRVPER